MQLLQQLVAAKLNCAAFGCNASIKVLINSADGAYANGPASSMNSFGSQLEAYNLSGDGFPIPPGLGPVGGATPALSQSLANIPFWDTP
jgi:hypothetical protein